NVRKYGMRATATVEGQFHAKAPVLPYPMPAIDVHVIKNVVFKAKWPPETSASDPVQTLKPGGADD
ncbi:MAG TPA: hypothetical protein VJR95_00600, partial [Rhodanobacter sp.]|nr:hypothetical protein [Rhodanobacter sp.]